MLTRSEILHFFEYDSVNGFLIWKNHWDPSVVTKLKGRIAGSVTKEGYREVMLNEKIYKIHRLIWFLENEKIGEQIDHIDGNRLNNKIQNLRSVNQYQNQRNQISHRNGRLPNTYFCKDTGMWRGRFRFKGKSICVGRFNTELEAYRAIKSESERLGV